MLYNTQNPRGGDVYGAAVTLDFSSNVHPLGTPPGVVEAIRAAAAQVRQYPDPYCRALTAAIAAHEGVPQPYVLCGGGAAELIYAYCDALRPRLAAEPAPTFSEYRTAAAHFGAQLAQYPLRAPDFLPDEGLLAFLKERKPDVLFLCTPNNPTGVTLPRGLLEAALRICRAQGTRVLLDECFLDFTDAGERQGPAGGISEPADPEGVHQKLRPCGRARGLLPDGGQAAARENVRLLAAVERLGPGAGGGACRPARAGLAGKGPPADRGAKGRAHRGPHGPRPDGLPVAGQLSAVPRPSRLDAALLRQKIAIRSCANYPGLGDGWYRTAVRLPEENEALLDALRRGMEELSWR